jgi:hypothetical protein
MEHYSGRKWENFEQAVLERTRVWRIDITGISGRENR